MLKPTRINKPDPVPIAAHRILRRIWERTYYDALLSAMETPHCYICAVGFGGKGDGEVAESVAGERSKGEGGVKMVERTNMHTDQMNFRVEAILDHQVSSTVSSVVFAGGLGQGSSKPFYKIWFQNEQGEKVVLYGENRDLRELHNGDRIDIELSQGRLTGGEHLSVSGKTYYYKSVRVEHAHGNSGK